LSDDRTSDGLVAVAVPSSPHALVWSWARPGHLEAGENENENENEQVWVFLVL